MAQRVYGAVPWAHYLISGFLIFRCCTFRSPLGYRYALSHTMATPAVFTFLTVGTSIMNILFNSLAPAQSPAATHCRRVQEVSRRCLIVILLTYFVSPVDG